MIRSGLGGIRAEELVGSHPQFIEESILGSVFLAPNSSIPGPDDAGEGDTSIVEFTVTLLRPGLSPRSEQLCERHVALLVEVRGQWPPVVVRRSDLTVVDGHHRVEAARRLGMASISGVFFNGSDEDAYLESVRRNVEHGLPLSIEERKAAAARIFVRNANW